MVPKMKFEVTFKMRFILYSFVFLCFASPFAMYNMGGQPSKEDIFATSSWFFGDQQPIREQNITFILDQADVCREREVFLLNMVFTRTEEASRRSVIRRTWGAVKGYKQRNILTMFVVGKTKEDEGLTKRLENEARLFKDVIMANFIDTYENLTLKTISSLQWATHLCPSALFVLKIDADMMVNFGNFIPYLETVPRSNFVAGQVAVSSPWRFYFSKWYISYSEYPYNTYPPYLVGSYVMSSDVVHKLAVTSYYTKAFKFEDVYVGINLKKLEISPVHVDEFYIATHSLSSRNLKGSYVAHYFTEESTLDIWKEVSAGNRNIIVNVPNI
ncbi:UDP-GalNAc:beta-1,3-N-acetylgalactosaminyltransferase 1-like isoform X2 [Ptychodera flava]|uniref:UDP-GalNAc:beta-1, 3-N-acetylgalactosaminyltransferase 1-like isoform X2 n=1 Tax=Ptychodera flava TaxID=63121 RepID=UPI00396A79B5